MYNCIVCFRAALLKYLKPAIYTNYMLEHCTTLQCHTDSHSSYINPDPKSANYLTLMTFPPDLTFYLAKLSSEYCIVLIALSRCNRVFTRRLRLCHSHTVYRREVRKGDREGPNRVESEV